MDEEQDIFHIKIDLDVNLKFSQTYKTWGDLLIDKGWWFPLNYWEIKEKFDKMDSGTILISKPGEREGGGYYSIKKTKQ